MNSTHRSIRLGTLAVAAAFIKAGGNGAIMSDSSASVATE